jgi:hypothetical protein
MDAAADDPRGVLEAVARHLLPGLTGPSEEPHRDLRDYNTDRARTERLTKGPVPDEILGTAKMFSRGK